MCHFIINKNILKIFITEIFFKKEVLSILNLKEDSYLDHLL